MSWETIKDLPVFWRTAWDFGHDTVRETHQTHPTSGLQVDTCSSSCSGGSLGYSMQDLSSYNDWPAPKEWKRRRKKSAQSKENLVDLFKQYLLEQKLKEEEREKNVKEMHLEKMRCFDRLLDLYEKETSK